MIYDSFQNNLRYRGVPGMKTIARFVAAHDVLRLTAGEIEILGRDLLVKIDEYLPGPAENKKFEAHRIYADLQLVVAGQEIIQYAPGPCLNPVTAYDPQADIYFFESPQNPSSIRLACGEFIYFFPEELHRPGCQISPAPEKVKKLVFKIRIPG